MNMLIAMSVEKKRNDMLHRNKKEELMDASMRIIARKGMASFSMKQVTDYVGVSEALIYRHFGTKELFLYTCYEQVDRQIAAIFHSIAVQTPKTDEEAYAIVHFLWMRYFSFLVQNDYRTVFYFEYRYSGDFRLNKDFKKKREESKQTYFSNFGKIIKAFDEKYHFGEKVTTDLLWTYILDTTGIFARRIIQGEFSNTPENYEIIFGLVSKGIMGLLEEK